MIIFTLLFFCACVKDDTAARDRAYRKLILGEWKTECLLFCNNSKLVFSRESYEYWLEVGSSSWKLMEDSLFYEISEGFLLLEKEGTITSHKITWLDQDFLEYADETAGNDKKATYVRP